MADEQPAYLSYLLRLWQVSGDGQSHRYDEGVDRGEEIAIWRASLESSNIGGRKVFANLDDLFGFLWEQTGEQVERTVEELPDYQSYLLRLWRGSGDGQSRRGDEVSHPEGGEFPCAGGKVVWRASLESVRTGERRSFASLDHLFDFLREQTSESPGSS